MSSALKLSSVAALVVALFAGPAFAQGTASSKDVRAAIEAANKKFSEAFAKRDAAALAAAYTPDGQAFPPNSAVVSGRPALQKLWQAFLDSGPAAIELKTSEVESAGDAAYETGEYEIKGKDGKPLDRGKYIVVWKRTGGSWQLHRDIWNSSMPPAKP